MSKFDPHIAGLAAIVGRLQCIDLTRDPQMPARLEQGLRRSDAGLAAGQIRTAAQVRELSDGLGEELVAFHESATSSC